jgi:uncharacterized protein YybS (DUF2232 family)
MVQALLYLLGGTLLTVLLQIAAGSLGLVGIFLNLLVPLPAAVAQMRKGAPVGGGIVVLTSAAVVPLGGISAAAAYLLQFGLGSFVLPLLLRRGWAWDRAVAGALGIIILTSGVSLGGYVAYHGLPATARVQEYVNHELDQALALYQKGNLPPDQVRELKKAAQQTAAFLARTYPALAVVVSGLILLFLTLALTRISSGRVTLPGVPFPYWKAPETLIWLLILAGFGMVFSAGMLKTVALNLLIVLLPVYFLQGMAIVSYYFRKRGISPMFRTLGYLLVTVLNPFPLIVTGIGVFDLWADFRKPRIKKT